MNRPPPSLSLCKAKIKLNKMHTEETFGSFWLHLAQISQFEDLFKKNSGIGRWEEFRSSHVYYPQRFKTMF